MRIYRIGPGSDGEMDINGWPRCWIAGLDCPVCGLWSNVASWYPTVECSSLIKLGDEVSKYLVRPRERPTPMNVAEFKELKALLEPVLGRDRPVDPGTGFGPVIAEVRGKFGDFAWISAFSPYVRESVFKEIQDAGFPITGVRAQLKFKRDPGEPLIQLEIRPTARLVASVEFKLCDVCGRTEVRRQKIVDGASFDESIPIQSIYEIPSVLVVNEAFTKLIRSRKLSNIKLTPQKIG